MCKSRRVARWMGWAVVGLVVAGTAASAAPVDHLIVISIDSLLPDYYLDEELSRNFPTLRYFKSEGSFAQGVRGVVPTLTFPSHTSLVTGVHPACHGIETNLIFDPLHENRGGWHWYSEDIRAQTLWQAAARKGLTTGSVFWPVTVGARIDHLLPAFWQIGGGLDGLRLLRALSTPGLLDDLERRFGPYDPRAQTDVDRIEMGLYLFLKHRPALMLIKLSDLDGAQHAQGPRSAAATAALKEIDTGLDGLRRRLAAEGLLSRSAVAIVSDHGSTPVHYAIRPEKIFAEQGWLKHQDGRIVEWKASPVIAGGLCAVVLKDSSDQKTLQQIRAYFQKLQQDPGSGIGRIYEKGEMDRMQAFSRASLLIEAAPGYRMKAGSTGPVREAEEDRGAHGYTPDFRGQSASFLLLGPGVEKGLNLGQIEMVEIAPRLAGLLGVELDQECAVRQESEKNDGYR